METLLWTVHVSEAFKVEEELGVGLKISGKRKDRDFSSVEAWSTRFDFGESVQYIERVVNNWATTAKSGGTCHWCKFFFYEGYLNVCAAIIVHFVLSCIVCMCLLSWTHSALLLSTLTYLVNCMLQSYSWPITYAVKIQSPNTKLAMVGKVTIPVLSLPGVEWWGSKLEQLPIQELKMWMKKLKK